MFVLCFLVFSTGGRAGETIVRGNANDAEGYIVRIIKYQDLLSKLDTVLAVDTIGSDGSFELSCNIEEITYAFIDIEFQSAEMHLYPGKTIEMEVRFDPAQRNSIYFDRVPLDYSVVDQGDINSVIRDINVVYNDFILDNFEAIYRSKKRFLVDSLKIRINKIYDGGTVYIDNYVKYKLASLEQAARMKSREKMAGEYLKGREILYGNVEYMYFFEQFYDKYLLNATGPINQAVILTMFEEDRPLEDYMDLIMKDPLIGERNLGEFFLLSNLKALHGHPDIPRDQVIDLINDLKESSFVEKHREIAENLVDRLNRLYPGTPAPAFSLAAGKGRTITLDSFKGEYLYMGFILSDNPTCRVELDILAEHYGQLQDKTNILIIAADKDNEIAGALNFEKKYPWTSVHYGNDITLLEKYDATTFPIFLLIGPRGEIVAYPAARPSEGLPEYLSRFGI